MFPGSTETSGRGEPFATPTTLGHWRPARALRRRCLGARPRRTGVIERRRSDRQGVTRGRSGCPVDNGGAFAAGESGIGPKGARPLPDLVPDLVPDLATAASSGTRANRRAMLRRCTVRRRLRPAKELGVGSAATWRCRGQQPEHRSARSRGCRSSGGCRGCRGCRAVRQIRGSWPRFA